MVEVSFTDALGVVKEFLITVVTSINEESEFEEKWNHNTKEWK
ncbi:MAG: hypothetical protein RR275_09380 [Lachnospiraceae bacterium]